MKALGFSIGLAILLVAGGCNTSRIASPGVYYDDIYYIPGATRDNVETAFSPVPSIAQEETKVLKKEATQQAQAYEKSDLARAQRDTRDFTEIQNKYASLLADENQEEVDSLIYYNEETGYWVDGFDGSEMDRDYAERLIRFHGPFTRIPYWSPLYDQFVYFNDPNWNVYVDGNYAYAFPSWSNRWYDSYRFNSWGNPWRFSFGFGSSWGYPSYWGGYYGGYYGMYDPFYSPFYSSFYWNRPYYYGYHPYNYGYYGGYNHHHHNNVARRDVQNGLKPGMSSNTRYSNGSNTINSLKGSNESQTRSTTITGQDTRVTRNTDGSSTITNGTTTYQRPVRRSSSLKSESTGTSSGTVSRYQGSGTSTGTVQTQSRRTTTQSYSQPQQSSRPAYNQATYTRPSSTRTTTGTVQSQSSTLKSGTTSSTPSRTSTYNRGSSTTQRTTVETRSYTPSRSSSSSSSSSYNRSSSSSVRSSGSSSSSSSSSSSRSSGSSSGSTTRSGRR